MPQADREIRTYNIRTVRARGSFTATCSELGLTTRGSTFEEAEAEMRQVILRYLIALGMEFRVLDGPTYQFRRSD